MTSVIELPNMSVPVTVNLFEVKSLPEVIVTVEPFTNADWARVPILTVLAVADEGVTDNISLNSTEPFTVPDPPLMMSVWYFPSLSYPATVNVLPVSFPVNVNWTFAYKFLLPFNAPSKFKGSAELICFKVNKLSSSVVLNAPSNWSAATELIAFDVTKLSLSVVPPLLSSQTRLTPVGGEKDISEFTA